MLCRVYTTMRIIANNIPKIVMKLKLDSFKREIINIHLQDSVRNSYAVNSCK